MKFSLLLPLFLCACAVRTSQQPLTKINIIDRNGLSETYSTKERLENFQNTDFLTPQPYQKVMRVYGKEKNGDIKSCITSYHPNGHIKQYLEAINNRAYGSYREWYPNGRLKIEAQIIGGNADINTRAEESWLFDGLNRAWDECGNLAAEIYYNKGELEGEAKYYHTDSTLWKTFPYANNKLHGLQKIYCEDGSLLQTTEYKLGNKDGISIRYWEGLRIACEEKYEKGILNSGIYYDAKGNLISSIVEGNGFRAQFGKQSLHELQEYRHGIQEGIVKMFDVNGKFVKSYRVKDNEKNGEEIEFYKSGAPRLLITWHQGLIHGSLKTWYENGNLESQKEMSENQKNGLSTAWYENGTLMLVEEYDNDKLVKGEYYRPGEQIPVSKIENGSGIATLFLSDGTFSRKVSYQEGTPDYQ